MPLDPVHVDGIDSLARRIRDDYDEPDSVELGTLWDFLDPLRDDTGEAVFSPVEGLRRRVVGFSDVALTDDEFPTHHGIDAGTLNPRGFTNGLTLDLAHTAAARVPSDLDLRRNRTIYVAVQSNNHRVALDDSWEPFDGEASNGRVVEVPSTDNAREAAHVFALYLAESHHLAHIFDRVEHLAYLDGPLYPLGLLRWLDIDPSFGRSDLTDEVMSNYFGTYDRALEEGTPVAGFVKNTTASRVVRRLRAADGPPVPWSNDAGFFRYFLANDELTFTNWFVSRFYAERLFDLAPSFDALRDDLLPAVMYVHDARHGTVHRVESPLGFIRDDEMREALTRQTLKEVALSRVPRAVDRADSLACISPDQREGLVRRFEDALDTTEEGSYDRDRWGYVRSSIGLTL